MRGRPRGFALVAAVVLAVAARPGAAAPPQVVLAGEGELDIRADRVRAESGTGRMLFEGGVTVTRGELALRCDRLEVAWDAERGAVERIEARGGVLISLSGREARGEEATFQPAEGLVVLRGSPVLTDGAATMRGDEIRFYLDGRAVECVRCRATWGAGEPGRPGRR